MAYIIPYFTIGFLLAVYIRFIDGPHRIYEHLSLIVLWPIFILFVICDYMKDFLNIEL